MSVDFKYRLQTLLDEHDMRPVDLANAINAPKSRISQWMHNKTTPNQESIHAIAQYFNVSEGWLIGYDVPKYIDREKLEKKLEACEIIERCYGSGAKEAVRKLLLLNADGQQRVHEYINLLLQSGQYDKRYEKKEIS